MSRGKRFESARRLFTTGLDKPHGRNWRSPRFVLEAAPIGGQPFAQDISRRDCTAFLLLFDTYDTRLLAQALSSLPWREKLLLGMHVGALSGIMLTVARDDPLVLGGSGRRIPYGRRLAE